MNCTGKMVRVDLWKVGNFSMVKLKKKSLSRGSFRTHGRVIGNKNVFIFGLKMSNGNADPCLPLPGIIHTIWSALFEPCHEKTCPLGILTRSDIKPVVQSQKMVRSLKFRIYEVEGLHYLCRENKGADQLHCYCAADLRLCFRICKKQVFSGFDTNVLG